MFKLTNTFGNRTLQVAVVGVGGTGSEIVSNLINLHLGLVALGRPGINVTAFDPDIVSPANIVRQRYNMADINRPKAEVLINRINLAYALGWTGIQSRFNSSYADNTWDFVISCVDTRASRAELHRFAIRERLMQHWKFWLDCGNDRTTGQVILGTPQKKATKHQAALPSATELHPELMDTTVPDNDVPSCSAAESLNHQDLMVNKMVAVLAIDMLWRLLRDKELAFHARYFDLQTSQISCRDVPKLEKATRRQKVVSTNHE